MDIKQNIENIKDRINTAARRAGRSSDDIKLLAVTKTHPVETIRSALKLGIEYIGENKVQEAEAKIPLLQGEYKEFHYIGHLQTNKIKKLLQLQPVLIHSIDSQKLAQKLNLQAEKLSRQQKILMQVNTSGEESKFGTPPEEAEELARYISTLPSLKLLGLMTIGKLTENEQEIRDSFRLLIKIGNSLSNIDNIEMKWFSMGMTNDFEIAVEEGANLLRLGTAIFGKRN